MSSHVQTFKGILIKTAALCMHGHGADLVWFGYLTARQAKKKKKKMAAQDRRSPRQHLQLSNIRNLMKMCSSFQS